MVKLTYVMKKICSFLKPQQYKADDRWYVDGLNNNF